jgi:molybdopterin biosynthesis enzyme
MAVDSSMQRIRRLTPLEAILGLLQSRVGAVSPRPTALAESTGAVLAEDVISSERPPRAIALRDGFAVAAAEIADAGPYAPVTLSLTARRIDAGDALPSGTDAVAPLDAITLRGDRAEAIAAVTPGDGVLQTGGDAAPGAVLRRAGQRLRAFDLAVLRAAGIAEVTIRSPRVALVSSSAARARMLDAAHAILAHHIMQAGGVVHETMHGFAEAFNDRQCDAIIGIGGTGSGRRDDAVQDLARLGQVVAHGIAISPGETAALGFVGERPVLLVPGRLDAALAVWLLIGRQLLAKLAGGRVDDAPATLTLRRKVASSLGMTELVPVRRNDGMVEPLGSGYLSLTALAHSDGWIAVPAASEGFAAGNQVAVNPWP